VDAFAQDIERYLNGEPLLARPESRWYRARKFVLRNKLAVGASALIATSLVAGIVATGWEVRVAVAERGRADAKADNPWRAVGPRDLAESAIPHLTVRNAQLRMVQSIETLRPDWSRAVSRNFSGTLRDSDTSRLEPARVERFARYCRTFWEAPERGHIEVLRDLLPAAPATRRRSPDSMPFSRPPPRCCWS
jgi:hypothetical protein